MTSNCMFNVLMDVIKDILDKDTFMLVSLQLNPYKTGGDGYVVRKWINNRFIYEIVIGVAGLLSYDLHNCVFANTDTVSNRAYVELVTTVAHECKHIEQYASFLTEESLHSRYYMACAAYVCSFNVDYYMSNYHNIMTEMDAELFSIVFARKYFGQLWGKKLSDIEILRMINSHCGKRGHDGWFFPKLYENVSSVDLFLKHFEKYAIEMCFDTRRVYHISRSSDPAAKYLRKHSELLYAWNMCQSGVAQDVLLAKITANLNGAGQQRMYFPCLYDKFHNHLTIETSRSEDLVNRTNKIFEMAKKYGY